MNIQLYYATIQLKKQLKFINITSIEDAVELNSCWHPLFQRISIKTDLARGKLQATRGRIFVSSL